MEKILKHEYIYNVVPKLCNDCGKLANGYHLITYIDKPGEKCICATCFLTKSEYPKDSKYLILTKVMKDTFIEFYVPTLG